MPVAQTTLVTTTSAPLNGSLTTSAASLDPSAISVTFSWDITNHGSGSPAAMTMLVEISVDSGTTWQPLCAAGRDKGYAPLLNKQSQPITMASVSTTVPAFPSRMVRATLSTTADVTTFMQGTQA
jgi:hypothetical protein